MSNTIDIFNGDADGICALIQLRQSLPVAAQLVTGVKRDINLLSQVSANSGDQLTVLDISLDKNRAALLALLNKSVNVLYIDHHYAGEIPQHPQITTCIDTDANTCTSLLMAEFLGKSNNLWAMTGAFGDNLTEQGNKIAGLAGLTAEQIQYIQQLGIFINYNAYGINITDLIFHPADLYGIAVNYPSPLDFIAEQKQIYLQLQSAYVDDMLKAATLNADVQNPSSAVYILPDEKWARRIIGVLANQLSRLYPSRAHAIVYEYQGSYQISVRAPLSNKIGADVLCSRFPDGGGRSAAAGINALPHDQLAKFISVFSMFYG